MTEPELAEVPEWSVATVIESGETRAFVKESDAWWELHDYAFWATVEDMHCDDRFFGRFPDALIQSVGGSGPGRGAVTRKQWDLIQRCGLEP